jgi:formamidopyrimidine-DNA glycosylase
MPLERSGSAEVALVLASYACLVPELPEVERARALIEQRALGRRIAAVDDSDTYVCRPHQPGELRDALVGRTLVRANRRGKTMWVDTDDEGPVLGLHLGMAGRIVVDDAAEGDPAPEGEKVAPVWDRFVVDFEDGGRLLLRDKRRLGRAVLNPALDGLGPDAAEVSRDAFRARVGRGDAPLKARIMDQGVIAGVGNLLADEALWRAGLSPQRLAGSLSEEELDRLRREIRAATRSAIRKGGVHTGDVMPGRMRGGVCPRCGAAMERATVGGRTTYWCPDEQT